MRRKLSALGLLAVTWCMLSGHSCCGGSLLNVCKVLDVLGQLGSGGFGSGGGSAPERPWQHVSRTGAIAPSIGHNDQTCREYTPVLLEKAVRDGYDKLAESDRFFLLDHWRTCSPR